MPPKVQREIAAKDDKYLSYLESHGGSVKFSMIGRGEKKKINSYFLFLKRKKKTHYKGL